MNRKSIIAIFALVGLVFAFFSVKCFVNLTEKNNENHSDTISVKSENDKGRNNSEKDDEKSDAEKKELEKKENGLNSLKIELESYISGLDGDWAVYVENLKTDEKIEINNKKMVSASLIKLFIMAKIYSDANDNALDLNVSRPYLEKMITVSDNEASNELVSIIGGGKYTDMYEGSFQNGRKLINEYSLSIGCVNSDLQRDMKNSRPNPIPEQNYTSVSDCGNILSRIYRKNLVSPQYDEEMMSLLKRQTRSGKIPSGLPKGIVCANKTGELGDVENDAAVVFSPACDYVICVMSNNVSNTYNARNGIVKISETVYAYLNPESGK